jgi:hypothetical protein
VQLRQAQLDLNSFEQILRMQLFFSKTTHARNTWPLCMNARHAESSSI